ncbi:hypothetical protein VV089_11255 [Candidatus Merdisoma sp. JLR.KK011]
MISRLPAAKKSRETEEVTLQEGTAYVIVEEAQIDLQTHAFVAGN